MNEKLKLINLDTKFNHFILKNDIDIFFLSKLDYDKYVYKKTKISCNEFKKIINAYKRKKINKSEINSIEKNLLKLASIFVKNKNIYLSYPSESIYFCLESIFLDFDKNFYSIKDFVIETPNQSLIFVKKNLNVYKLFVKYKKSKTIEYCLFIDHEEKCVFVNKKQKNKIYSEFYKIFQEKRIELYEMQEYLKILLKDNIIKKIKKYKINNKVVKKLINFIEEHHLINNNNEEYKYKPIKLIIIDNQNNIYPIFNFLINYNEDLSFEYGFDYIKIEKNKNGKIIIYEYNDNIFDKIIIEKTIECKKIIFFEKELYFDDIIKNYINNKKIKKIFQSGGIVQGKSHEEGGVKTLVSEEYEIYLEGGEAIINKNTVADEKRYICYGKPIEILSDLNEKGGGEDFFPSDACKIIE